MRFVLNTLINFLGGKDNALVLAAILSFIATLFLVFITKRYVSLTKEIAKTNLQTLNLTDETEKRKTTLELIYKFDRSRFLKLSDNLIEYYFQNNIKFVISNQSRITFFKDINQLPTISSLEINREVSFFIDYFDTMSIMYLDRKLDEYLFKKKILDNYFIAFIISFREPIIRQLNSNKKFLGEEINWQQDFLLVSVELLREYIKLNIDKEVIHIFNNAFNDYQSLLPK